MTPLLRGRPANPPSLTDTLCTRCGLCCDGSLFADVELAGRAEATRLEVLGLEVEDGDAHDAVLLLPCRALQGTRCSVYVHRPKCCRSFECRLLQEARRGAVGVDLALERIAEARRRVGRVRELLTQLGPCDGQLPLLESCAEALAREGRATPAATRTRAELEAAMSAMTEWIRQTFLTEEPLQTLDPPPTP